MLLNCNAGTWESLGQGEQTSQSWRKSVLNIHWKDWCWSWSSNSLATWCEEQTHWKNPDAGKHLRQEVKGTTEDEMVAWHHWFSGHEFEQTPGDGEGQGRLPSARKLQSMGSQRAGHDLVTEQWTTYSKYPLNAQCPHNLPLLWSEVKNQLTPQTSQLLFKKEV